MTISRSAWSWIIGVAGIVLVVGGGFWPRGVVNRVIARVQEREARETIVERRNRGIPGEINGWQYIPDSATGPALYRLTDSHLTVSCPDTNLKVSFVGFEPAQAWPQPVLSITVGTSTVSRPPDLRWWNGETSFEANVPLTSKLLTPLRRGDALSIEFRGKQLRPPSLPVEMREAFVDNCATRMLPGN